MDEAELRAENQRLRAQVAVLESRAELVLEATNDGVWDWDLATDQAFFSRRWKALLGYEEHEVADTGTAFFELIHEEDRPRVQVAVEAHLERRAPYIVEFRMRTKDGGWREIEARGQAVWDAGKPVRMAGVHTDVSERHRQQRERLRNEELIEIQTETIRALGVPILQVWKGVLCVPIVGAVDEDRATNITVELLDRVAETAARYAVLDLTGAEFRQETAQYLASMTRTLRLIGARGVLCGISPATAKMLADMQLDFGDVATYRDLHGALQACLQQLGS